MTDNSRSCPFFICHFNFGGFSLEKIKTTFRGHCFGSLIDEHGRFGGASQTTLPDNQSGGCSSK
jgi:hypothetical protein